MPSSVLEAALGWLAPRSRRWFSLGGGRGGIDLLPQGFKRTLSFLPSIRQPRYLAHGTVLSACRLSDNRWWSRILSNAFQKRNRKESNSCVSFFFDSNYSRPDSPSLYAFSPPWRFLLFLAKRERKRERSRNCNLPPSSIPFAPDFFHIFLA